MHLNKDGTVLISTIIILSLISLLGSFIFKIAKNNNELSYVNSYSGDIYNLEEKEEKILKKFMDELNKVEDKEEVFGESFVKKISNSDLEYDKESDKLLLISYKDQDDIRTRQINHILKDEKIILVPTYNFKDTKDEEV